jgi:hypothetical protein
MNRKTMLALGADGCDRGRSRSTRDRSGGFGGHRRRPFRLDAPGPVVVEGDEDRLRQAVMNLVGNPIVHTPEGTEVDVSVRSEDHRALLTVEDRGPAWTKRPSPTCSRASGGTTRAARGRAEASAWVSRSPMRLCGPTAARSKPGAGPRVELGSRSASPSPPLDWVFRAICEPKRPLDGRRPP